MSLLVTRLLCYNTVMETIFWIALVSTAILYAATGSTAALIAMYAVFVLRLPKMMRDIYRDIKNLRR